MDLEIDSWDEAGGIHLSLEARIFENELMRSALDTARIGLCVISSDGLIVMLGGDVAAKLGTSDSHLLGQHFRNLRVSGLVVTAGQELFSLDAEEVSAEAKLTRPDGTLTVLLFQGRTINHLDGNRYRVLSIIDLNTFGITRNRFLELRQQLDALNSAVLVTDVRKPDMPITWVNKQFEKMTGYSASFAVGRNCRFLQGKESNQPVVAKLKEAIERRQSCQVLIRNFRRDGTPFLNELFISPLYDGSGELSLYVGILRECAGRVVSGLEYTSA